MDEKNESTPPEITVVDMRSASRDSAVAQVDEESEPIEAVERPSKVLRIGSMIKQLLDEVRQAPLDDMSRARLKEIYETSLKELSGTLSPELSAELGRMIFPLDSTSPSDAELRVAQAQLVGWLEGLFHGIQATLFAQQMATRSIEEARQRGLPVGDQSGSSVGRTGYL